MKPNAFIWYPYCREDFFSMSLAYIANLFPAIGQGLIQRIAVLAGKRPDYFGAFGQCEFTGHEFPENHTASRPDLKIQCSKGTIYFENKLESPASLDQMERHARLVRDDRQCSLILVSNIPWTNPRLQTLPGYLSPEKADHYLWVDFLPVFKSRHRSGSHAAKILADFDAALKTNGMIGRTIKGASGSLYTPGSDAAHLALRQLWELMDQLGFKLSRKAARERTIRAYPSTHGQYPLMNPIFRSTATWLDERWDKDCLDFAVISKGDRVIDRHLSKFTSTRDCTFVADPGETPDGYFYHGHFICPVQFIGKGACSSIDFAALNRPLSRMLDFLRASHTQP